MQNVEEVRMTGQDSSHWRLKGPLGKSVEFDARTTEMDPSRGIGWNTTEGEVMTSGEARFEEVAPGRTRVDVTMNYADPRAEGLARLWRTSSPTPRGTCEKTSRPSRESSSGGARRPREPDAEPLASRDGRSLTFPWC